MFFPLAWAKHIHTHHPNVVWKLGFWVLAFLIPYTLVLLAAKLHLAAPNGNFHWIYKPIRSRIAQRPMGFVHAVWMTYLGLKEYVQSGYRYNMLEDNTEFQTYALEWSITYLVLDTFLDVLRGPELIYFIHHVVLFSCFYTCVFVTHIAGGMVSLYLRHCVIWSTVGIGFPGGL